MTADDDDGYATSARQLERDRSRLRAAARHPGVVDHQHVGAAHRPVDAEPAWVNPAPVRRLLRHDREPDQRHVNARLDEGRQRMTARPPSAARHHRHGRRARRHPRRAPHRLPMFDEITAQHRPQPRRRFHRARAVRLVPPQINRELTTPHRVSDRRDRVREQFPRLAPGQVALIAPGKPDRRRPPAGPAGHPSMLRTATDKTPPTKPAHKPRRPTTRPPQTAIPGPHQPRQSPPSPSFAQN